MTALVFDIETGPLPESELEAMMPQFDPSEVKFGNIKDPAKITEKVSEAEANHRRNYFDKAALDPLTGRVVAIGVKLFKSDGGKGFDFSGLGELSIIGDDDEAAMLKEFWDSMRGYAGRLHPLIGFNIFSFDLPFLIKRSWKHRISIPGGIRRGRYWSDQVIDLRDTWQLGDRQAHGSLDRISKHLGVGAKNGDGKVFAELWRADRAAAEAYLKNDVELTAKVADVLGVVV